MDPGRREAAEHARRRPPHHRHPGGASDHDDLAELADLDSAVPKRPNHRLAQPVDQPRGPFLERVAGDQRLVPLALPDVAEGRLRLVAEQPAGALGGIAHHLLEARVERLGPAAADRFERHVDDDLVEVLAAELVVAGRRSHFDHAFENLDDRNVERPPRANENGYFLVSWWIRRPRRRGGSLLSVAVNPASSPARGSPLRCFLEIVGNGEDRGRRSRDSLNSAFSFSHHAESSSANNPRRPEPGWTWVPILRLNKGGAEPCRSHRSRSASPVRIDRFGERHGEGEQFAQSIWAQIKPRRRPDAAACGRAERTLSCLRLDGCR